MLREPGNVRWTSESRHRIIESFRSDMSASLCVQEMRKFVEEYHTVRRSERQWAGLWTDIVIEQVQIRR